MTSPLQNIRKYCLWCCCGVSHEVAFCPANESFPGCPLWVLRFGRGIKGIRSLKQIRLKCLECSSDSTQEVTDCRFKDCPLYFYRSGHNPKRKGKGGKGLSPERMTELRLKKVSSV